MPLDHADPDSRTIRLPVRRLRAADHERRIGTLVTIAGGPGQRGTDLVRQGAHGPALEAAFDIVSWDPRGTSGETLIGCIPAWDPWLDLDRTPDTRSEQARLDRRTATLAERCRDVHADLLPHLGTRDATLDLEHLRVMLGESRISLVGASWGTRIALAYATHFPDRVRAVVLDGVSDPDLVPGETAIEQAAAFGRALDDLLDGCATDPACPFHADGKPGTALDALLARLDDEPLPAGGGARLTQSDAHEALAGSLMAGASARGRLLVALAAAEKGDGGPLRRIADGVRRMFEASGISQGVFAAITCADTAADWARLSAGEVADLARRIREASPRLGAWLWSPPAATELPPVGLCAMLPGPFPPPDPTAPPDPTDAAGAGPVLVLATTGDPSTPFEAAQRVADRLEDGVLIVHQADGHLAFHPAVARPTEPGHRCVLDAIEAYLLHGDLPRHAAVCGSAAP